MAAGSPRRQTAGPAAAPVGTSLTDPTPADPSLTQPSPADPSPADPSAAVPSPAAGRVAAVSRNDRHRFSKSPRDSIRLLAGIGVEGDAHAGPTVQHLSRKRWHPEDRNLRQVHLLQGELHDGLLAAGFPVGPGLMGENVTTRGLDLLALPTGAVLRLGASAAVELTGLRNPCVQLDRFAPGLMAAVLDRDEAGRLLRRAGVMAVVLSGGDVRPGDHVTVDLPIGDPVPLAPV